MTQISILSLSQRVEGGLSYMSFVFVLLYSMTQFDNLRPLSAGGSGLELVGIKEPQLPSHTVDVIMILFLQSLNNSLDFANI